MASIFENTITLHVEDMEGKPVDWEVSYRDLADIGATERAKADVLIVPTLQGDFVREGHVERVFTRMTELMAELSRIAEPLDLIESARVHTDFALSKYQALQAQALEFAAGNKDSLEKPDFESVRNIQWTSEWVEQTVKGRIILGWALNELGGK